MTGALCVQELLWRAPWNQSANLVQASDHRLQLKLSTVVGSRKAGTNFTCRTSTKVQILTRLQWRRHGEMSS
jgi:hypothetical protein